MSRARLIQVAALAAMIATPTLARAAKPQKEGGDVLIGYVQLEKAILEVDEGKRAKDQLQATFAEKQKKLSAKKDELEKMNAAIEAQQSTVKKDDPVTAAKRAELQQKAMEFQQTVLKEQQEIEEAKQKALGGIADKMRKVIKEIAEANHYTLILEGTASRLLYARPALDITNEVIRKYNAQYK